MNYIKLNTNIKSIIFNYLTIPSNYVRHNYRVNIDLISIMSQINNEKFEKKIMDKFYDYILTEYSEDTYIDITNNLSLNINIKLIDFDEYEINFLFYYHIGKLQKMYSDTFTIENFNIRDIIQMINHILLIFVCRKCLSFCYTGNKYLQLCNKCENNHSHQVKTELCCVCNEMINDKICSIYCNHHFHIECIKTIKTYHTGNYIEYMYCPKCNQTCQLVYINNKRFEFDTTRLQLEEDRYYTDEYIEILNSYLIEDNNKNIVLNDKWIKDSDIENMITFKYSGYHELIKQTEYYKHYDADEMLKMMDE